VSREERLFESAIVLWEGHILRRIIQSWKKRIGASHAKTKKLTRMFMLVAAESTHNNTRAISFRKIADNFLRNKALVVSWICINDDFIRNRKAEKLMPQAMEHFEIAFFDRVVKNCFDAIIYFVQVSPIPSLRLKG